MFIIGLLSRECVFTWSFLFVFSLCKSTWGHCSIYNRRLPPGFSYRRLYMELDEGSLTFNANMQEVLACHTNISIMRYHIHSVLGNSIDYYQLFALNVRITRHF